MCKQYITVYNSRQLLYTVIYVVTSSSQTLAVDAGNSIVITSDRNGGGRRRSRAGCYPAAFQRRAGHPHPAHHQHARAVHSDHEPVFRKAVRPVQGPYPDFDRPYFLRCIRMCCRSLPEHISPAYLPCSCGRWRGYHHAYVHGTDQHHTRPPSLSCDAPVGRRVRPEKELTQRPLCFAVIASLQALHYYRRYIIAGIITRFEILMISALWTDTVPEGDELEKEVCRRVENLLKGYTL